MARLLLDSTYRLATANIDDFPMAEIAVLHWPVGR